MKRRGVGRALAVALVCLIGGPAILVLTYVGWSWGDGPRDEFAQWLTAVTSAGTLLAAVAAAIYAAGAFRLEVERDDRLQNDRRQAQASLVAAWPTRQFRFEYPDLYSLDPADAVGDTTLNRVGVAVRNASELPVTETVVTVHCVVGGVTWSPPASEVGVLPPSTEPVALWLDGKAPLVVEPSVMNREYEIQVDVWLRFRDSTGARWRRRPSGELEPVPGEEEASS